MILFKLIFNGLQDRENEGFSGSNDHFGQQMATNLMQLKEIVSRQLAQADVKDFEIGLNEAMDELYFEARPRVVPITRFVDLKIIEIQKPRYNHAYTVAFSIESDNTGENVTPKELIEGLRRRLRELESGGDDLVVEACGMPYDSYET